MPVQPKPRLLSLLGLAFHGDVGQLTLYRRPDRRLVMFKKTWPNKPPTGHQLAARDRFKIAAITWNRLSDAQRAQWRTAARRASLRANGYNLWTWWQLIQDEPAVRTLEHQTKTTLL